MGDEVETNRKYWVIPTMYWLVFILIIGVWLIWFCFVAGIGVSELANGELVFAIDKVGQFGDSFGALNTLFSGLAFVALVIAILLQSKELKLQMAELSDTRKVLDGQRVQFEKQSKTMSIQAFENTFFQLIVLYNDTVNNIYVYTEISGRQRIVSFYDRLLKKSYDGLKTNRAENPELCILAWEAFYRNYGSHLEPYYNTMYRIFEYIDYADIENKELYMNIFKAQLSRHEKGLLFYNGLSLEGERFKYYVEKYGVFDGLIKEMLFGQTDDAELYSLSAFGTIHDIITKKT